MPLVLCAYCINRTPDCTCERCSACDECIPDCTCVRCSECDAISDECICPRCERCDELVYLCECYRCDNCTQLDVDCSCDRCEYCNYLLEQCQCDQCARCGERFQDCHCTRCPECDELDCLCGSKRHRALKLWDIDPDFALPDNAANFYVLYDLALDGLDEGLFKPYAKDLAERFARYVDMAVGGEVRHSVREIASQVASPVEEVMQNLHGGRSEAWLTWFRIRQYYGIEALRTAIRIFELCPGTVYGGEAWARVAGLLYSYLQDEITPTLFVDSLFGIQHNGGSLFDKVWSSSRHLFPILSENQSGNVAYLVSICDRQYAAMWRKHHAL